MGSSHALIRRGRTAFERREWSSAYSSLAAADAEGALEADDLELLAVASYLTGREDDFLRALQAAHRAHADEGRSGRAARCAFWLGIHLGERGDAAQANGWIGRAARLVDAQDGDSVERGYLLVPAARRLALSGDMAAAGRMADEAEAIARRFQDPELMALALHLHGRVLLFEGRVSEGLALLDEAMVSVTADELSPLVTGLVYCGVISACRDVWALERAEEWTSALTEWCERQPDMVAYTGECRIYRAEILRRRGDWADAVDEARRASESFGHGSQPDASGFALYQQAEVDRLSGRLAAAEEAYRAALRAGYEPQPGLALLRMAQGDVRAADAAIRRALTEARGDIRRARLLPAFVEIVLAVGAVDDARTACAELGEIAERFGGGIDAVLEQARGAVELAAGRADVALHHLRRASRIWREMDAPYDAARVGVLLALACKAVGDEDGADLEMDAARAEFRRLGATPDLSRVDRLAGGAPARDHGLTPREREVLSLVATGRTNRAIAEALSISEKTVARHVANIFGKLGLSSRSAATAYAYEHDLLDPPA